MVAKPKLKLTDFAASVVNSATDTAPVKPDDVIKMALIDFKRQVRTSFPLPALKELAASIKNQGLLQPVVVLRKPDGRYQMIAGERRYKAAELAGLIEIPVIVKEGLTEREIREIQVAENNDREGLSIYDECMGVVEDIEQYGFKEAMKIWNRSEAWVSKRGSVKKLAEPVLILLRGEKVADLEIAIALNQIFEINATDFTVLAARFDSDEVPTRDEVRAKLGALREWDAREKKRENDKTAKSSAAKAGAEPDSDDAAAQNSHGKTLGEQVESDKNNEADKSGKQQEKAGTKPKGKVPASSAAAAGNNVVSAPFGKQDSPEQKHQAAEELMILLRADFYDWGAANREQIEKIQALADELELDMNDTDWVLWSGFLSTVLPMIHAIGEAKSENFMKKLMGAMKKKKAVDLWIDQHPIVDGAAGDAADERVKVPATPKNWRL